MGSRRSYLAKYTKISKLQQENRQEREKLDTGLSVDSRHFKGGKHAALECLVKKYGVGLKTFRKLARAVKPY